MNKRINLLGVPIDSVTIGEAVEKIKSFLNDGSQHHVMTPNSEMLVEASRNPKFKSVLNSTSLNLPDSIGIKWFGRLPARVTGVDTVIDLCKKLGDSHPIFLLGGTEEVGQRTGEVLQKKNSDLVIAGCYEGSPSEDDAEEIIKRVNESGSHLLLVAFGAPKQDLWIRKHLNKMPKVRVAMGVGGTFDFIAGRMKRAPSFMRKMGLEWLWRLILEPKRFMRIIRATIVFPLLVLRSGGATESPTQTTHESPSSI